MVAQVFVFNPRTLNRALLVIGLSLEFLYLSTSSFVSNSDSDENLPELNSETFQKFLASHDTTVVEFYQPW
jgi:hypothetical protein